MKQTKTTLILGVLLAILAIGWAIVEIKNSTSQDIESDKVEESSVIPVAQKTIAVIFEIAQFRYFAK